MTDTQAAAVPLDEQERQTLAHYEEVTRGRVWSSVVPRAIRAYYALLNSRVGGKAGLPLNAHELGHDAMDDFVTVLNTNLDRGKHGFYESFANAWQVLVRHHIAALALRGGEQDDGIGVQAEAVAAVRLMTPAQQAGVVQRFIASRAAPSPGGGDVVVAECPICHKPHECRFMDAAWC